MGGSAEMSLDPERRPFFRLFEALQNFCDPVLVNTLRQAELRMSEDQHRYANRPLLSDMATIRKATRRDWRDVPDGMAGYFEAWDRLIENFKGLIELEKLELEGVQIAPTATTERASIPGAWAAMMTFDFRENTISTGNQRYASIRVWRAGGQTRPAVDSSAAPAALALPPGLTRDQEGRIRLTTEAVALLSDDTILALLEEHGRRVVAEAAYPLIQPSKVSFGAILARRMEWRAKNDQLALTFTAESVALIDWLGTKIEHHHIPTPKGLGVPLRDLYRKLSAGSKRGIA